MHDAGSCPQSSAPAASRSRSWARRGLRRQAPRRPRGWCRSCSGCPSTAACGTASASRSPLPRRRAKSPRGRTRARSRWRRRRSATGTRRRRARSFGSASGGGHPIPAPLAPVGRISHSRLMSGAPLAGNPPLLFIIGGGDEADGIVQSGSKLVASGTTDLDRLVEREPYHRLHVTRNLFRKGRVPELDSYRVLVNLITEPEKNVRVLEIVRKLLRGARGRVINRPEAVLRSTRDQVARRFDGVPGLIVPKAIRLQGGKPAIASRALEKAGFAPPLIL